MIERLNKFKKNVPGAIAPTIVAALIFFITYFGFGAENSMIAPFATLSYLSFRNMKENIGCMVRHFCIYQIIAVAAFFAVFGPIPCFLINALFLFWISYFLINEYQPNNYFPSGMALIIFQISPVYSYKALLIRMLALAVSFVVILVFVLVSRLFRKDFHPIPDLVSQGFTVCEKMLTGREQTASAGQIETEEALWPEIRRINHSIAMEIYSYNRASLRRRGKVNWYCRFIVFFQCFDFLMRRDEDEEARQRAESLYNKSLNIFQTVSPAEDYRKLTFRYNRPDIRNFRFRFALRMVIVMTPVLTFCYISNFENVYWLAISVFFMMIPFSNETRERVRERIIGSIAGIIICFVLFTIFPWLPARIAIMLIANFFVYSADSYASMVTYITCSVLAIQTVGVSLPVALGERLMYNLIGAVIALLANRFIFPIRMQLQIEYLLEILARIRRLLISLWADGENQGSRKFVVFTGFGRRKEVSDPLDKACRIHQTDQLVIKSYLISRRIEQLNLALPEDKRDPGLAGQEYEHMKFMSDFLSKRLQM